MSIMDYAYGSVLIIGMFLYVGIVRLFESPLLPIIFAAWIAFRLGEASGRQKEADSTHTKEKLR